MGLDAPFAGLAVTACTGQWRDHLDESRQADGTFFVDNRGTAVVLYALHVFFDVQVTVPAALFPQGDCPGRTYLSMTLLKRTVGQQPVAVDRGLGTAGESSCRSRATIPETRALAWEEPVMTNSPVRSRYSGCSLVSVEPGRVTPVICPPGATTSGLIWALGVGPRDEKSGI
jgi:hypothetical protein